MNKNKLILKNDIMNLVDIIDGLVVLRDEFVEIMETEELVEEHEGDLFIKIKDGYLQHDCQSCPFRLFKEIGTSKEVK